MRRAWALAAAAIVACATAPPVRTASSGASPAVRAGPVSVTAAPATAPVRPLAPPPAGVKTLASVTFGAVGDVLMHGAVKDCAAQHAMESGDDGYDWLYDLVRADLSAPDLTFANLETPVAPKADKGSKSFVFNAPVAAAAALQKAGVDLVSVANNHAFDQGRAGFEETLQSLESIGLPYLGAGPPGHEAGPRFVELNGLKLAFLGFTETFNDDKNACETGEKTCPRASLLDPARAVELVREAAPQADAVIVSLHWGREYSTSATPDQVKLAHALADAGALLVIGHHPHVLEPLELYRRPDGQTALVAYSLGNFISNQSRNYVAGVTPDKIGNTRDGALVRARIERRDYGRGVTRVELAGVDYLPLWTENDTVETDPKKKKPDIRPVVIDRALAEVRADLAALPDPLPKEREAEYVRLRQREEALLRRKQLIVGVLGEDFLRELPDK